MVEDFDHYIFSSLHFPYQSGKNLVVRVVCEVLLNILFVILAYWYVFSSIIEDMFFMVHLFKCFKYYITFTHIINKLYIVIFQHENVTQDFFICTQVKLNS